MYVAVCWVKSAGVSMPLSGRPLAPSTAIREGAPWHGQVESPADEGVGEGALHHIRAQVVRVTAVGDHLDLEAAVGQQRGGVPRRQVIGPVDGAAPQSGDQCLGVVYLFEGDAADLRPSGRVPVIRDGVKDGL